MKHINKLFSKGLTAIVIMAALSLTTVASAATYQYVTINGQVKSISANSVAQANAFAAADIAPHSGVLLADDTLITANLVTPTISPFTPAPLPIVTATGDVMVMSHICKSNIKNRADFEALPTFVDKVLACPTIVLPKDNFNSGAVAGDRVDFNFAVVGSNGQASTIGAASFNPAKVCETDINQDVTGDGKVDPNTCLDTSNYTYHNMPLGNVAVAETMMPKDTHFGAIEFTPVALMPNNDAATKVFVGDEKNGLILLNTAKDDNASVMVHVYNFMNS